MNFCIFKGVLTLAFGNVLALSAFASGDNINDFSEKNNTVKVNLEKAKSEISEKFKANIKNLKGKPDLVLDQDSIESILTEITNSMLDIDPYNKSARYSDGRTILEFYEGEGFEPINKYLGENWNYVVLMNLLQNMKNGDIEVIKNNKQKTELMNEVVMDIRNAHIREASYYNYDDTQCVNELNKAGNIIKQYFDILDLWNFVLKIKQKYYKPESTIQKVKLEKAKSKISEKFKTHIENLKGKPSLELDQDSIESILTEITNSMLDIDPYNKSARYSDGRTILEFYEDEGFEPIDKYLGENWNYVVLMNLLQNMKNGDIKFIKDDEQKTELMNKVVMDIRNAYIRKANSHDYDDTQRVNELNEARDIIKQYFDILDLWNFVLQIKQEYYKPESPITKNASTAPMQITKDHLPNGIYNEDSTCYLNAALQCLYNSAPIRTAIQKLSQSPQNTLAQKINVIFSELEKGNAGYVNFNGAITDLARYILKRKKIGNQDPSEAIERILDYLIDEEIKVKLETVNEKYKDSTDSSKKAQEEEALRDNSTIGKICYLHQATVTICSKCNSRSIKKDPPTTKLVTPSTVSPEQLQLPEEKLISLLETKYQPLQEPIKWYENEDKIEGENSYFCEKCKTKQPALRRLVLCNLPKVLIIQLSRHFFYGEGPYNGKGKYVDKGAISCPDELKIRQYKYRLRSFVYGGGDKKGHIIMEGYADDGTPYIADDSKVSLSNKLSTTKAQMLVYELME